MKLKILGCYSPNIFLKPVSCYRLDLNGNIFYLDLGYLTMQKIDEKDYNNMSILISHNHIDHAFDLILFALKLKISNIKLQNKIKIFMPSRNKGINMFKILRRYFINFFDVYEIKPMQTINMNGIKIKFCPTKHVGESYAIKIKQNEKSLVYTSDLAKVDCNLINFCKKADCILVEGGHPVYNNTPFGHYHGNTRDILENINIARPRKVLVTHLEARVSNEEYNNNFPVMTSTFYECVELGEEYLI